MATTLFTIGYEGADLADFIATLQAAGVPRVVDVRALAISRRRGFAKRALSSALTEAGIEYVHLRGLGNPKPGREAAWAGDNTRFRSIFISHMTTDVAQADLVLAASMAADGNSCLLCFERDHAVCHRAIVADALSGMVSVTVQHLGVTAGLAKRQPAIRRFQLT